MVWKIWFFWKREHVKKIKKEATVVFFSTKTLIYYLDSKKSIPSNETLKNLQAEPSTQKKPMFYVKQKYEIFDKNKLL